MKKMLTCTVGYEKFHLLSEDFLIEFTNKGHEIQRTSACIPILLHSDVVLKNSSEVFEDFIFKSIKDCEKL